MDWNWLNQNKVLDLYLYNFQYQIEKIPIIYFIFVKASEVLPLDWLNWDPLYKYSITSDF